MLTIYLGMLENEEEKENFTQMYLANKQRMLGAAERILYDHAASEDAVHTAFMRIIAKKEKYFSYSGEKQGNSCVLTVKRVALNMLRAAKKEEQTDFEQEWEQQRQTFSAYEKNIDAMELILRNEKAETVRRCLSRLSEEDRIVLMYKYVHQMANAEIAKQLEIDKHAVESRIYRAKRRFQQIVLKEGDLDEYCGKEKGAGSTAEGCKCKSDEGNPA